MQRPALFAGKSQKRTPLATNNQGRTIQFSFISGAIPIILVWWLKIMDVKANRFFSQPKDASRSKWDMKVPRSPKIIANPEISTNPRHPCPGNTREPKCSSDK